MTPQQFDTLMQTSFRAAWVAGGLNPAAINWPNLDFEPATFPLWCRFQLLNVPVPTRELGGGDQFFVARGGLIAIEIYVRAGQGKTTINAAAETVLKWLETFGIGEVRFQDPGLLDVGVRAGWFQINAQAGFEYDSVRDLVP